jgi:hypothetical protein
MKHVKLFEDFSSSNYGGNKNSSNLAITVYDKMDADKLADKANEFGFPILGSANVAANYLRAGKIWSIENGSDLYFYQPSVDAEKPITTPSNKRISLDDFCSEIGCTENEILSRTEGSAGDIIESFIVLTGNDGDAFYAISHTKNKGDINLLKMRFSGEEDVFDAIPYTGKNYVGSGYDNSGNIKLKEYKTSEEGLKDGYYEFYSDNQGDENVEPGEGEGILWGVPSEGFTIYADKGYATTITNDKYLGQ